MQSTGVEFVEKIVEREELNIHVSLFGIGY